VTVQSKPVRLPLILSPENRGSTTNTDAKLVNCYAELNKETGVCLYRRPGMAEWGNPSATTGAGMGVYWWNGAVYSIFAGTLYKNLTSVATGLDMTGGVYSFSSLMGDSPKLVMQNGAQAYAYDDTARLSANLHSINVSYPQYTCKGLCYLNGAMYVMQHFFGTSITPATIWGSAVNSVNQPGDWTALDFITAQIEPDSGVYLAKQQVYCIALKEWTTEFFFDAGNPTGSPLQFYPSLKQGFGCASQDSVQSIKDVLVWISTSRGASYQIVWMVESRISVVSTPSIDRLLNQADLSVVYSWQIECNGHSFYVVTIKNNNLTLAFDLTDREWSQWTDANGNYVPIVSSTRDSSGNHILQHETNGILYYGGPNYLTDNSALIPITAVTPGFDGTVQNRKHLGKMSVSADQVPGEIMYVQVSDDDYQTWSQPRMVDLSLNNPNLIHCGTFRRRAFKFTINNSLPFRLRAIDLYLEVGEI